MKRLLAVAMLVCCMLCGASFAFADGIDIKVKGQWDFAFGWASNTVFKDSANRSDSGVGGPRTTRDNDNFQASQRIRTQINFIASESLQGVLMFDIGMVNWGGGGKNGFGSGGGLDADGVNIATKRAYLDFVIPNSEINVRMGLQGFKLPSTPMGSPLLEADVAGILVNSPLTDWLSITGFWMRPFDAYYNDNDSGGVSNSLDDETDIFGVVLPFTFEGVNFTPWFMYGFIGANSGFYDYLFAYNYDNNIGLNDRNGANSHSNAWWVGAHLELTLFDPLVFNIEGIYGHLRKTDLSGLMDDLDPGYVRKGNGHPHNIGASGWFIGATLDYSLDFMTTGVFGWYASGDKESAGRDGKLGRLPVFGNDGGSFYPTSFGTAGYWGISQFDNGRTVTGTGTGTWGVGIHFSGISFVEDLTHSLRFAFYQGTNDSDLVKGKNSRGDYYRYYLYSADALYLTDKDNVWEVNFLNEYQVYENLTMAVELGWLHLDTDKDTWRRYSGSGKNKDHDNAWKAQVMFQYSF